MQNQNLVQELHKIFQDLKSKTGSMQDLGTKALHNFMESHRELSDEVFFLLLELAKSNEKHEIMGLFKAINRIVKAIRETQTLPFVNRFLPLIFQQLSSSDVDIITKAVECVGTLVKLGGSHSTESIDTQVKAALSWLRGETFGTGENRKLAAVLVLKEFCVHAPVATFNSITAGQKECLKDLLGSLKDSRSNVREAAFDLVQAFLKLISNREEATRKELYLLICNKAKADITSTDVLALHASILIVEALLTHSPPDFLPEQYGDICESVFKCRDHKNVQIKKAIVVLIPKLAAYSIPTFVAKYLQPAMAFILDFILKKAVKERGTGFVALGSLCKILPKENFMTYVQSILRIAEEEVTKNKKLFCVEVLDCIEMAMANYGKEFISQGNVDVFLDNIFFAGLNEKLISALKQIMMIPGTEKVFVMSIQIRLLNAISVLLTQKSFNFSAYLMKVKQQSKTQVFHAQSYLNLESESRKSGKDPSSADAANLLTGHPIRFSPQEETKFPELDQSKRKISLEEKKVMMPEEKEQQSPSNQVVTMEKEAIKRYSQKVAEAIQASIAGRGPHNEESKASMIILALKTLSDFDFTDFAECVAQFVQEYVLNYLEDENSDIRKAAIKTGCSLYVKNSKQIHSGNNERVNEIVERFLVVSMTDSDYKIRTKMLKYLNKRFDYLLAQKTNLKLLFQCVQNNVLEVRQQAIIILGRIADHNPSVILPYLRNLLVQLLSKLEYAADIKEKEEAAKMLSLLMKYSGRMCEPYTEVILNSLVPKLKDSIYTSMVPSVLSAMGQLSEVGGEIMKPKLKEVIPLIIESLKDQSNTSKREIAVKALTHIVESTSKIINFTII